MTARVRPPVVIHVRKDERLNTVSTYADGRSLALLEQEFRDDQTVRNLLRRFMNDDEARRSALKTRMGIARLAKQVMQRQADAQIRRATLDVLRRHPGMSIRSLWKILRSRDIAVSRRKLAALLHCVRDTDLSA